MMEANICRIAGLSFAQPSRIRSIMARALGLGAGAAQRTDRKPAAQDEMGHAVRMAHGVGDGYGAALRDPDQGKPVEAVASTTVSRSEPKVSKSIRSTFQ